MNEVQLSDSLPVIETEIRQYQNLAGESIFEIGRRLKHVKENDLAHGEFGNWLKSINLDRTQAHRFIKVSEEIKDVGTYQHLGLRALSEIATLPEPERAKEHITSKGETKTPDEMTVKELRELKKRIKEKDEQLQSAHSENNILHNKLEDAENAPPKVIYKERVETVVPDDYVKLKRDSERFKAISDSQENKNIKLQQEIDQLKREISNVDEKSKKYDQLNEEINKMNGRLTEGQLRIKNQKLVYDLVKKSEALISEVAPLTYSISHLGVDDNKYAKEPLIKIAENLEDISSRIRKQLNENQIIEVE